MRPENVLQWLDTVDEDNLDPLEWWGVPPPRHPPQDAPPGCDGVSRTSDGETYREYSRERNAEIASMLKATPPSGILLRNGSIRVTHQHPKFSAYDVENENHPKSLVPGFPTSATHKVDRKDPSLSPIPGIADSKATDQQAQAPPARQLQISGKECNNDAAKPKRLPILPKKARVRGLSGTLLSTPAIPVEDDDPVAINCQGARVVEGHQHNGIRTLPSMVKHLRIQAIAEEALHRSNAIRRPSNVRVEWPPGFW